jgi:hypothetical protein
MIRDFKWNNEMSDTLSYLNKYITDAKIFTSLRSDDPMINRVPQWWGELLQAGSTERFRLTLRAWEAYRNELPTVFNYLSTHLRGVSLLTDRDTTTNNVSIRLLYEIDRGDRTLYYVGGNPTQLKDAMPPIVKTVWHNLPSKFRQFYESLHNGWYYLASGDMGPSPVEAFFILSDDEWGILDDIGDPGCDLDDLLAVYSNGMGDHVALSIDRRAYGDVLWWKAKRPVLKIDAWAVMDAWTEIGMTN